jgi:hypothetical protein
MKERIDQMDDDERKKLDDELRREFERECAKYEFTVEDARRHFGEWDMEDPVVWAILRVVQALLEAAIDERREAIAALQRALASEPRGFQ